MDPNETLRLIRATVEAMGREDALFAEHAHDLMDHVTDLDEWLTRGGFLPSDWRSAQTGS